MLGNMSAGREAPELTRLGKYMDQRASELGLSWVDIAARSGVTRETLRKMRYGLGGKRGYGTLIKQAIEQVLRWTPGSIDITEAGGCPTPLQTEQAPTQLTLVPPLDNAPSANETPAPDSRQFRLNQPLVDEHGRPLRDENGDVFTPGRVFNLLHYVLAYSQDGPTAFQRALRDVGVRLGLSKDGPISRQPD